MPVLHAALGADEEDLTVGVPLLEELGDGDGRIDVPAVPPQVKMTFIASPYSNLLSFCLETAKISPISKS